MQSKVHFHEPMCLQQGDFLSRQVHDFAELPNGALKGTMGPEYFQFFIFEFIRNYSSEPPKFRYLLNFLC